MSTNPSENLFRSIDARIAALEKKLWQTGINAIDILRAWGWKFLKAAFWLSKWLLRAIFKIATPVTIILSYIVWGASTFWWAWVLLIILVLVFIHAVKAQDGETFFEDTKTLNETNTSYGKHSRLNQILAKITEFRGVKIVVEAFLPKHFIRSSPVTKAILIFVLIFSYLTAIVNYFFSNSEGVLASFCFRVIANVHHWIIDDLILGSVLLGIEKLGFDQLVLESNNHLSKVANFVVSAGFPTSKVLSIASLLVTTMWFIYMYGEKKQNIFLFIIIVLWVVLVYVTNLTFFSGITTSSQ